MPTSITVNFQNFHFTAACTQAKPAASIAPHDAANCSPVNYCLTIQSCGGGEARNQPADGTMQA